MYRRITKSTPILIVGAVLGFLCWSYVDDPAPRPKEVDATAPLKSLVASLFPEDSPAPARDPFDSRGIVRPGKRKKEAAAKTMPEGDSSPAARVPGVAASVPLPHGPGDLALEATHLTGGRRIALINGAVYAEGDDLKPTGKYRVARIYPHRVVLESQSETVELTYPAHDAKPKPSSLGTNRDNPDKMPTNRTNSRKTS
jgi:hypothetical protein